jgi:hypothetical protein
MGENWSDFELEQIIGAYFGMLEQEILGKKYNKTEVRNSLIGVLRKRTKGSIEYKNQNITAVLMKLGYPYVNGYKAAWNYQQALLRKTAEFVERHPRLYDLFHVFAESDIVTEPVEVTNFKKVLESAPEKSLDFDEEPMLKTRITSKVNYLELEQSNRRIGKEGESFALKYEKWRLTSAGKDSLADKVEWISETKGDGAGFDILSRNTNGTDRYIEVKTTKLGKETPIFFTKNENDFSRQFNKNFYLYRVFNFISGPRLFLAQGSFEEICNVKPWSFRGYFQSN